MAHPALQCTHPITRYFRRSQALISFAGALAALLLLFVTLSAESSVADEQDTPASPPVDITKPAPGANDVSIATTLQIILRVAPDPASLNNSTFTLIGSNGPVTGVVTLGNGQVSFTPSRHLQPFSPYTATFQMYAPDGTALTPYTWSFRTGFDSNLPIVVVNTGGGTIVDDPKIPATMQIHWDVASVRHQLRERANHFEGRIGIEIRGNMSQSFPKKQYGFETWDASNDSINVSLLDLPRESDWILQGPYLDKTLMRNYVAYTLSNRMGRYAARSRFVELFLNTTDSPTIGPEHYQGVYLLMEKIKRDNARVAIAKLDRTHTTEPDVSGGYIVKLDALDPDDWYFNTALSGARLIHVEPDADEIIQPQRVWLINFFDEFERVLASDNFADPHEGYRRLIDVDAFVDHLILNEFLRNVDAFRISAYLHKDRGGKLAAGPVWDFDLAGGYIDLAGVQHATGWHIHRPIQGEQPVPFWWTRLLEDPCFAQRVAQRWHTLRQGPLATVALERLINDTAVLLDEAQARNFARWSLLGQRLYLETFVGQSYEQEVAHFRDWLITRANWIDENIQDIGLGSTPQPAGLCVLTPEAPLVLDRNNTAQVYIGLTNSPVSTVTLQISPVYPAVVTPTLMHFVSTTWNSPQPIAIQFSDAALEQLQRGPTTVTLWFDTSTSLDANYASLPTEITTMTVTTITWFDLRLPLISR
jgi:hypothetical protein